ncbi:hypothetical protein [Streptomyces sp. NPDC086519]|uniref:hypothetical protein n=1 Tax=Streptomyces sp. NPDC086519 TaxID=3154863 RepID=UPI00341EA2DE
MSVPPYQAEAEFFRMPGHPARIRVPELSQDRPMPVREVLAAFEAEPSALLRAARRILTEMPAGRGELPAEPREAGVAAR